MPHRRRARGAPRIALAAVAALLSVLAAACAATGTGTSPAPSNPGVADAASAMAAVRARSPLFDGIDQKDSNKIGQGSWWDAQAGANGWRVTVEVGSLAFVGEQGAQLDDPVLAQLQAASTAQGVGGWAFAGPTCPVERPGDSACGKRMVGGAVLVVTGADGREVARFTTDGSGLFRVHLDPGEYTVQASPVQGLMGTPGPATAEVQAGDEVWLDVAYDTGIR
jgi:hypothetical protein